MGLAVGVGVRTGLGGEVAWLYGCEEGTRTETVGRAVGNEEGLIVIGEVVAVTGPSRRTSSCDGLVEGTMEGAVVGFEFIVFRSKIFTDPVELPSRLSANTEPTFKVEPLGERFNPKLPQPNQSPTMEPSISYCSIHVSSIKSNTRAWPRVLSWKKDVAATRSPS